MRNRFRSDHRPRPHAIFDHHADGLNPPNMVGQQARQNIGAASRRERNYDLYRSRRLRLSISAEQPEEDDSSGCRSELKARKFHRLPPVSMKLHRDHRRAKEGAMSHSQKGAHGLQGDSSGKRGFWLHPDGALVSVEAAVARDCEAASAWGL
jgi:hypothetical protein